MKEQKLAGWIIHSKDKMNEETVYLAGTTGYNSSHYNHHPNAKTTTDISKAKIYTDFESLLRSYRKIKTGVYNKDEDEPSLDIGDLKISKYYFNIEEISLEEDLYKLELQKRALKKLEQDEIVALGVEKEAMFTKLDEELKDKVHEFYPDEELANQRNFPF